MTRALLAAAALLALALPAAAADESLVLQPSAPSVGPGGTVEVQVLARVHPNGKAVVAVRATDCVLSARGGGAVGPSSDLPGEVKWTYRAPEAVAMDLEVVLEGRLRSYPDANGACSILVKAPGGASAGGPGKGQGGGPPSEPGKGPPPGRGPGSSPPAGPPPAGPGPAAPPAAGPAPNAPPAAAGDDEEGDLVEGAEAVAADPVGKLVTLEKWRAKASDNEPWNEKPLPPRGEPLYAPGVIQEYRFRVNAANAASVEIQWWRSDRTKRVRSFTAKNRQLDVEKDQDGLLHGKFVKWLNKEKGEYTFAVVVTTADGKTLRENLVVHRAKPPKEEGEGKGHGGGKR